VTGRAATSEDGLYRYVLERDLPRELGTGRDDVRCLFVMLNPSTADAFVDDPTVRRCCAFARSWGYTSLSVVNLFAFRATDPAKLLRADDPVGPDNDHWIIREADRADLIVAAWGTQGFLRDRDQAVLDLLAPRPVYCIGTTRTGMPRHPLYVVGTALPELLENSRPAR
jgi:hypothetical protein